MATGFDTLVLDPDFIPLPDTTFVTNFDSDRNYILEITPVQGSGTIDVDSKSIHLNASGSRWRQNNLFRWIGQTRTSSSARHDYRS